MRVLAVTDSDSFTKWGASVLNRMPRDWSTSLVVLRTPALPSARQLASALADTQFSPETTPMVDLPGLSALIAEERPDVVLLSVRGPVVRVLVRLIVAAVAKRPLIVSGLPGISIPETLLALYYRSQVDLFILHSKREVSAFAALAQQWGIEQDFALSALPFLAGASRVHEPAGDIIFAAQAKVPATLPEREELVGWLAEAARRNPDHRVVLKLRGTSGEAQTHSERFPLDEILAGMADAPANLVVSTGPMSTHLQHASALVTVSSTAAIEAVALGVPALVLDDFGVSAQLINTVFEDSGLSGSSDALIARDFKSPNEHWLDQNYFHAPSDENWIAAIEDGVRARALADIPLRAQFRATLGGNLRRIWDRKVALGAYDRTMGGYLALAVGVPLRGTVRLMRKARAKMEPAG